jgi:hypothetical protein
MRNRHYQTFIVETNFRFPIDMMRYDGCFPHTEKDAGLITRNLTDLGNNLKVTMGRYVATRANIPTEGRWESFGCKISEVETK